MTCLLLANTPVVTHSLTAERSHDVVKSRLIAAIHGRSLGSAVASSFDDGEEAAQRVPRFASFLSLTPWLGGERNHVITKAGGMAHEKRVRAGQSYAIHVPGREEVAS